ncbi:MAG: YicC family protein [Clostridiales bacterium]|nr:YicC family protein [Clostridiales bacterium]
MRSMTGYGRGESSLNDRRFIVEIRAVNHRYNDITIKLPRIMLSYEDKIKKAVSKEILRGKTDVFVSFETFSKDDYKVSLNEALADCYTDVLNTIKERYSLEDKLTIGLISRFPDVISVEKASLNENNQVLEGLMEAVGQALDGFVEMRTREGEHLKADILDKLVVIREITDKVKERSPYVAEEYKQRLTDRISELCELNADEGRILTEVAIFAEKSCIDEELTRLYSHLKQMEAILQEENSIGRKLDFLVQEMNREVNTIGSKSNDLIITSSIVELKSEIEKVREQVQNIE